MKKTRAEKEALVSDAKDKFEKAEAVFLTDFQGIESENMTALRSKLREADVEYKILRNTYARLAVKGTGSEGLTEHLKGTNAIAFSYGDVSKAAKELTAFAKEDSNLKIKVGVLSGKVIDINEIKALSDLPSREELLATVAGMLNNVATSAVSVISAVPRKVVTGVQALHDQKSA